MIDDKESYERNQMGENIEVLKLVKLSYQKNIDNIDKESDERNRINTIEDNASDERHHIRERKANEIDSKEF